MSIPLTFDLLPSDLLSAASFAKCDVISRQNKKFKLTSTKRKSAKV